METRAVRPATASVWKVKFCPSLTPAGTVTFICWPLTLTVIWPPSPVVAATLISCMVAVYVLE